MHHIWQESVLNYPNSNHHLLFLYQNHQRTYLPYMVIIQNKLNISTIKPRCPNVTLKFLIIVWKTHKTVGTEILDFSYPYDQEWRSSSLKEDQMLKWSIFAMLKDFFAVISLTWSTIPRLFCSHLPYMINHSQSSGYFRPLYKRTAQVQVFWNLVTFAK